MNTLQTIYSIAKERIGLPNFQNQILLEIPLNLHINRLGFGKGDLIQLKANSKLVYYKAEAVVAGIKNGRGSEQISLPDIESIFSAEKA